MQLRLLTPLLAVGATHWVALPESQVLAFGYSLYESATTQDFLGAAPRKLARAVAVEEEVSEDYDEDGESTESGDEGSFGTLSSSRSRLTGVSPRRVTKGVVAAVAILAVTAATLGYQMFYNAPSDVPEERATSGVSENAKEAGAKPPRVATSAATGAPQPAGRVSKKRIILGAAVVSAATLLFLYQKFGLPRALEGLLERGHGLEGLLGSLDGSRSAPAPRAAGGQPNSGLRGAGTPSRYVTRHATTTRQGSLPDFVDFVFKEMLKWPNNAGLALGAAMFLYGVVGLFQLQRAKKEKPLSPKLRQLANRMHFANGTEAMILQNVQSVKNLDVGQVMAEISQKGKVHSKRPFSENETEAAMLRVQAYLQELVEGAEKAAKEVDATVQTISKKLSEKKVPSTETDEDRAHVVEGLVSRLESEEAVLKETIVESGQVLERIARTVDAAAASGESLSPTDAVTLLEHLAKREIARVIVADMHSFLKENTGGVDLPVDESILSPTSEPEPTTPQPEQQRPAEDAAPRTTTESESMEEEAPRTTTESESEEEEAPETTTESESKEEEAPETTTESESKEEEAPETATESESKEEEAPETTTESESKEEEAPETTTESESKEEEAPETTTESESKEEEAPETTTESESKEEEAPETTTESESKEEEAPGTSE
ncbi:putative megakaryocyte stimulating factor [Neospora caninum Liverpool]|uniref:Megakaryocyte stimulating factor, putative n=1 Tax=Neospora caninum (strain Liverpool) TaxID=572307 RepID=F0VFP0_NEOCL|nr:putative megakaryocyte stimulating factor [Neospora caninum Liverpool]CBZ52534.1 putative megakaryocyte stimulating factor [Neospora caninum Liverpool]CEL66510.1 TPA: megakaryocyte stimulating factor, putative [Neospora caninum Liverpool]|eukprot:XP_003882566.1 putative megakaryocyte stimulating factor [Neospora caninum Liverpool]